MPERIAFCRPLIASSQRRASRYSDACFSVALLGPGANSVVRRCSVSKEAIFCKLVIALPQVSDRFVPTFCNTLFACLAFVDFSVQGPCLVLYAGIERSGRGSSFTASATR